MYIEKEISGKFKKECYIITISEVVISQNKEMTNL